ncbi:hypothetical protein L914_07171, partial [Phytophthora nicotianae]
MDDMRSARLSREWCVSGTTCAISVYARTGKFSMQCAFLEKQWNKQSIVACGSEDNRILMWNVGSQDVTSVLTGHDHPVLALAAHPTHALMVSGSNRDIKMWTPSVEADGDSNMESNGTKDLS